MSEQDAVAPRRWNWLKIALVASLALNVLVGAALATRYFRGGGGERFGMANTVQLVPRKFMAELSRERRREINEVLNRYRKEMRGDRDQARALMVKVADAIASEPYSPEAVKAAIAEFAGQGAKLAGRGGNAAIDILGMLTPDERKRLAQAMRDRVQR